MAYALGPLPALNDQASPAGLVAGDPTGCAGEGQWRREAVGGERASEREPPREGGRFAAGQRERNRVKQGERRQQTGGGEWQSSRREGGASLCHADAQTLAHTHGKRK